MKQIIKIQPDSEPPLMLTWIINNICQNSCSYCDPNLYSGKNHHYEWGNAKKFFKLLFEKYPKIHCSVAGGEPTLSPFFKEIVKTFYDAGHTINVTTNGAKSTDFWRKYSKYLLNITFSYHAEFPDPKFIEKITTANKMTRVGVRVMMHPLYWDQCMEMYNRLLTIDHISLAAVRALNHQGVNYPCFNYTDDQLQWLINTPHISKPNRTLVSKTLPNIITYFNDGTTSTNMNVTNYVNAGMTNFKNYTCHVGLQSLFINWDGNVFLGNCSVGGAIGHINDPENIKWPTDPIRCTKTGCYCSTDIKIEKYI